MIYETFKVFECGDRAILLEFGDSIDLEINRIVQTMFQTLKNIDVYGIVETVPCYRSLLVSYDPLVAEVKAIEQRIRKLENNLGDLDLGEPKKVKIPVAYGGDFGPDIKFVADYHHMSIEKVIELHTQPIYINSMFGFDPGFAALIGLSPELETPRLENPRLRVPAGSVGIGAAQTGIYSFERAGGWQIIGRTPLKLFAPNRNPQVLVEIGDEIEFIQISREEYFEIFEKMEQGEELFQNTLNGKRSTGVETFLVLSPGLMTTVQDGGRFRYQWMGMAVSGALDRYAYRLGNLLLEQEENTSCLEMTLIGPKLEALQEIEIVISGAGLSPEVNGVRIQLWTVIKLRRGDILSFSQHRRGCRAYLCVKGGFYVPEVMGSRSTNVRLRVGGFKGRHLVAGDRLLVTKPKKQSEIAEGKTVPSEFIPIYRSKLDVRVILGPHDNYFTEEGIKTFLESEYRLSLESNREGFRLTGLAITFRPNMPKSIPSEASPVGGIQVRPNGQPLILMNDLGGGGYARIGHIISSDLHKITQLAPGDGMFFKPITLSEAYQILKDEEKMFTQLKESL